MLGVIYTFLWITFFGKIEHYGIMWVSTPLIVDNVDK